MRRFSMCYVRVDLDRKYYAGEVVDIDFSIHQHHMYDKEKLFRYRRVSRVNIYNIENYEDYFYGYMADHTGYVKYFDLKLYDEGFVLELPERSDPFTIPPFAPDEKIFKVQKESQEWAEKMDISYVGDLTSFWSRKHFRRQKFPGSQSRS